MDFLTSQRGNERCKLGWLIHPLKQIEDILVMPELYSQLVSLLEITHFESREIACKAANLEHLFHEYVVE